MIGSVLGRLDRAGRNLVPGLTTLFLVLLAMVPLHLPRLGAVAPMFGLMAVYYWVIHRPDLLRPAPTFLIGLLQDLLAGPGMPIGLHALVYVFAHWFLLGQRRFFIGNSFIMLWWGFALIALGAALLMWVASSVLNLTLYALDQPLFQALLSVALFPAVAWLLIWAHRFLPQPA